MIDFAFVRMSTFKIVTVLRHPNQPKTSKVSSCKEGENASLTLNRTDFDGRGRDEFERFDRETLIGSEVDS
jgi:hypothetical protein